MDGTKNVALSLENVEITYRVVKPLRFKPVSYTHLTLPTKA